MDGGALGAELEIQVLLPGGTMLSLLPVRCRCYVGVPEVPLCTGAFHFGPDTQSVILRVSAGGMVLGEQTLSLPTGKSCGRNTAYVRMSIGTGGVVQFGPAVIFDACK